MLKKDVLGLSHNYLDKNLEGALLINYEEYNGNGINSIEDMKTLKKIDL